MNKFMKWLESAAPVILGVLAVGGVVATAVCVAKETPDVIDDIQNAEDAAAMCNETVPAEEKAKIYIRGYKKSLAVGTGTVICIASSVFLSHRSQAKLTSAYALLSKAYDEYQTKIIDICGPQADHAAKRAIEEEAKDKEDDNPPWDELQAFTIAHVPKIFERTMLEVQEAEYHLNRNFVLRGSATFNEFLSFLNLEPIPGGDDIGWNQYDGEAYYGYQWIDFTHRHTCLDDGMSVCEIFMPFEPHREEPLDSDARRIADGMFQEYDESLDELLKESAG